MGEKFFAGASSSVHLIFSRYIKVLSLSFYFILKEIIINNKIQGGKSDALCEGEQEAGGASLTSSCLDLTFTSNTLPMMSS